MKNNLYSKVKTNLYMDVKKGINSNKFRPPKNDVNKSVNNTKNLGIDKSYLNIANSSRIPRLANSVDIALDKNLQKKNNRSNINSPDRTNINIEKNRYGYETVSFYTNKIFRVFFEYPHRILVNKNVVLKNTKKIKKGGLLKMTSVNT